MPKQAAMSLTLDAHIDIATFLLQRNGVPSRTSDLPSDVPTLRQIVITPQAK
jgi:hypothetical protein